MRNPYMNMTVAQALDDLKSKASGVKIGAAGDSGFIYCGPIDFGAIQAESETAYNRWLETMDKNEEFYLKLSDALPSLIANRVSTKVGELSKKDRENLNALSKAVKTAATEAIEEHRRSFVARQKTITKAFNSLNPWVDVLGRKVTDAYQSIAEKGVMIILFDGYESGDYWDESECKRAHS